MKNSIFKTVCQNILILLVFSSFMLSCSGDDDDAKIVAQISLNKKELTLELNRSERLIASFTPAGTPNKAHVWSSSAPQLVTVDETGLVTAVAVGNAVVTATALDGGSTANCNVKVLPKVVPVTSISLNYEETSMYVGDSLQLKASLTPTDATNQDVSWISSNDTIASVTGNGLVKALQKGEIYITATSADGNKKAACKITIKPAQIHVTGITLNYKNHEMYTGEEVQLEATITPANATNKTVDWVSSNPKVATVSDKGLVKALSEGEATITATTEDGNKTAACHIKATVKIIHVTGIRLNKEQATVPQGKDLQLQATLTPADATDKTIHWESSNTEIATVDKNGLVETFLQGTVQITATTNDGGKKASCEVNVVPRESALCVDVFYVLKTRAKLKIKYKNPEEYIDQNGKLVAGICYGENPHPTIFDETLPLTTIHEHGTTVTTPNILEEDHLYYVRPYTMDKHNMPQYHDEMSFYTVGSHEVSLSLHRPSVDRITYEISIKRKGRYSAALYSHNDIKGRHMIVKDFGYLKEGSVKKGVYTNDLWYRRDYMEIRIKDLDSGQYWIEILQIYVK